MRIILKNSCLYIIITSLFVGCMGFPFSKDFKSYKRVLFPEKGIYPTHTDVSVDDKIYFTYAAKNKGAVICSMDINSGALQQITEDGNSDFHPIVSHNGKKIVFKRGALFGSSWLYTVNSDGTDCKLLLDKGLYLSDAIFSNNDSTIYFIGGALFNGTSIMVRGHTYCQDIFAIDVDGQNFRRISFNCITTIIFTLILMPDNEHLMISFPREKNPEDTIKPSFWAYNFDYINRPGRTKTKYDFVKKNYKTINREPYYTAFNGLVNISTGAMKEINIDTKEYFAYYGLPQDTVSFLIEYLAPHPSNEYGIFSLYKNSPIYKYDFQKKVISILVDSINGIPSNGNVPDSINIDNLHYLHHQNKLIARLSGRDGYKFVLFDIESETIEKELVMDTNKFIPSINRTIFREIKEL